MYILTGSVFGQILFWSSKTYHRNRDQTHGALSLAHCRQMAGSRNRDACRHGDADIHSNRPYQRARMTLPQMPSTNAK